MQKNDRDNVLSALQGDTEAYGRLVDAYQGMVFAVALSVTGNYSDSQDIVQETFLHAYRKLRTLSDPAKFSKSEKEAPSQACLFGRSFSRKDKIARRFGRGHICKQGIQHYRAKAG